MTNETAPDRKIVKIAKPLGRLLQWVKKAIRTDEGRPALTSLRVEPRESKYGKGVIVGSDGFRIHLVNNVNTGEKTTELPHQFEKYLDLEDGNYKINGALVAQDHILEFQKSEIPPTFPDYESVIPSMRADLKPVAILSVSPFFLMDAVRNAPKKRQIIIRVFMTKAEIEEGKLYSPHAYEVISGDKDMDGVSRLAVIMPMHYSEHKSYYDIDWPMAWNGWPEEEKDEETES